MDYEDANIVDHNKEIKASFGGYAAAESIDTKAVRFGIRKISNEGLESLTIIYGGFRFSVIRFIQEQASHLKKLLLYIGMKIMDLTGTWIR